MHNERGLKLIEVIIVVAIIAILATVALLAYSDDVVRSRVTEGMSLLAEAKLAVIENASSGTPLSQGFSFPTGKKNIDNIQIDAANGAITITMNANAGSGTLLFTPSPTLVAAPQKTIACSGPAWAEHLRRSTAPLSAGAEGLEST